MFSAYGGLEENHLAKYLIGILENTSIALHNLLHYAPLMQGVSNTGGL